MNGTKGFVISRAEEPSLAPLLIFASDVGTRVRRQRCFISCKLLQHDIFEQRVIGGTAGIQTRTSMGWLIKVHHHLPRCCRTLRGCSVL